VKNIRVRRVHRSTNMPNALALNRSSRLAMQRKCRRGGAAPTISRKQKTNATK
jgi:hypothetical protein